MVDSRSSSEEVSTACKLEQLVDTEQQVGIQSDGGQSVFPDGTTVAICTHCARRVIEIIGRGEVWGYFDLENPDTEAASGQDGHDFAIVDGRYVVDVWIRFVAGLTNRVVFDLQNPADEAPIRWLYGNRSTWSRVDP